jgi:2-isopropylmalate synthase
LPHEVEEIVAEAARSIPGDHLGVHAHNDTDNAAANSLAAIRAGARQVQGTLNGLGERCGNANLISLIPTLLLKKDYADRFDTGVSREALRHISHLSHFLDELLNRAPNRHAPYVGAAAFAHKGGLHVSAVLKNPRTYEHIDPGAVGNARVMPVSDQAGRANILAKLRDFGIELDAKDPRIGRILDRVKEQEFKGFSYDGADASFELMARNILGRLPQYFKVERFNVSSERRHDARGNLKSVAEAIVTVNVDGEKISSVGEGNGPVDALNKALRKDLGRFSEYLSDLELADYKVRIFGSGTDAETRVLIESKDASGKRWTTVGVSPNIVDASFQALMDSITFKLFHEKAKPAASQKSEIRNQKSEV